MSITVTNKEAIEVVAKQAKERGTQPGETAGFLIVYAGNRLAALRRYEGKKGPKAPKPAKKAPTMNSIVKKNKDAMPLKAAKELTKISTILRAQEAERKVAGKSSTLPTLVFEDVKKPKKTPKTSFAKKFKKEKEEQ